MITISGGHCNSQLTVVCEVKMHSDGQKSAWRLAVGEVWALRIIKLIDRDEIGTSNVFGGKQGYVGLGA